MKFQGLPLRMVDEGQMREFPLVPLKELLSSLSPSNSLGGQELK